MARPYSMGRILGAFLLGHALAALLYPIPHRCSALLGAQLAFALVVFVLIAFGPPPGGSLPRRTA